jgi:hypothetical protein
VKAPKRAFTIRRLTTGRHSWQDFVNLTLAGGVVAERRVSIQARAMSKAGKSIADSGAGRRRGDCGEDGAGVPLKS